MKTILRLLLLTFFGFVIFGYYLKNNGSNEGDKWIGIGVLILSLLLMPLFIFHRYRKRNIKDFVFKKENLSKKTENQ